MKKYLALSAMMGAFLVSGVQGAGDLLNVTQKASGTPLILKAVLRGDKFSDVTKERQKISKIKEPEKPSSSMKSNYSPKRQELLKNGLSSNALHGTNHGNRIVKVETIELENDNFKTPVKERKILNGETPSTSASIEGSSLFSHKNSSVKAKVQPLFFKESIRRKLPTPPLFSILPMQSKNVQQKEELKEFLKIESFCKKLSEKEKNNAIFLPSISLYKKKDPFKALPSNPQQKQKEFHLKDINFKPGINKKSLGIIKKAQKREEKFWERLSKPKKNLKSLLEAFESKTIEEIKNEKKLINYYSNLKF